LQAFSMVQQQDKVALQVQDQVLGQVNSYRVGVLHVQRQDQVNQFITLQVQEQPLAWTLTPLEQKVVDRGLSAGTIIFIDQKQLPDVTMNGPVIAQDHQEVAFFKATPSHVSTGYEAQYVFLQIEYPSKVVLISQAQYIEIAGRPNFF
jgi:hypothetical protein